MHRDLQCSFEPFGECVVVRDLTGRADYRKLPQTILWGRANFDNPKNITSRIERKKELAEHGLACGEGSVAQIAQVEGSWRESYIGLIVIRGHHTNIDNRFYVFMNDTGRTISEPHHYRTIVVRGRTSGQPFAHVGFTITLIDAERQRR